MLLLQAARTRSVFLVDDGLLLDAAYSIESMGHVVVYVVSS